MSKGKQNIEWALEYAEKGFPVFPVYEVLRDGGCSCRAKDCKSIGKHPITRKGVLEATTAKAQIESWWKQMPSANIGIATGRELPDGGLLIVVDVDTDSAKGKKGAESLAALVAEHGELPATLTQRTGSGGTHYCFRTTKLYKNDSNGKIGKDIDCRCHSGYVVAPPSKHYSGGRYKWLNWGDPIAEMPEWIGARLEVHGEEHPAASGKKKRKVDITADANGPLPDPDKLSKEDIREMIAVIPADERDTWMTVGVGLKHELPEEDAYELWDEWAATSTRYKQVENLKQWRTYRADFPEGQQITIGSVIQLAQEHGWKPKPKWASPDGKPDLAGVEAEWVYCEDLKRFIRPATGQHWDKEQIQNSYGYVRVGKKMIGMDYYLLHLGGVRKVASPTYRPGNSDLIIQEAGLQRLNLWRPGDIAPCRGGNTNLFLDHMAYLVPDERERKLVLDFMAHCVQRRGVKMMFALLLKGDEGTGKSWPAYVISTILGSHNCEEIEMEELKCQFNDWIVRKEFISVNEVMVSGRLDMMNKFKPYITQPTIRVNTKGLPRYPLPNMANFFLTTNYDDSLVLQSDKDRRYLIVYSTADRKPDKYYDGLWAWSGLPNQPLSDAARLNLGSLYQWLLDRDISGFNGLGKAPFTEGKRELVAMSRTALDAWVQDSIRDYRWPFAFDLVNLDFITDRKDTMPQYLWGVSPHKFGAALRRAGAKAIGYMETRLNKIRVWAVRNIEKWENESEPVRGHYYERHVSLVTGTAAIEDDDPDGKLALAVREQIRMAKEHADSKPM